MCLNSHTKNNHVNKKCIAMCDKCPQRKSLTVEFVKHAEEIPLVNTEGGIYWHDLGLNDWSRGYHCLKVKEMYKRLLNKTTQKARRKTNKLTAESKYFAPSDQSIAAIKTFTSLRFHIHAPA